MNKKLIVFALTAVIAVGVAGVSVAGGLLTSDVQPEPTPRAALADIGQLRAFQTPKPSTESEKRSLDALRTYLGTFPAGSLAARADLSSARAFDVSGSDHLAWIAKTANGGICAFSPDSAGNVAAACSTLADFNQAGLISISGGSDSKAVITVVQPDGVGDPVVKSPDGTSRRVPLRNNVAIATGQTGDAVSAGGVTVATDNLRRVQLPK